MPFPLAYTSIYDVPKSIPISNAMEFPLSNFSYFFPIINKGLGNEKGFGDFFFFWG